MKSLAWILFLAQPIIRADAIVAAMAGMFMSTTPLVAEDAAAQRLPKDEPMELRRATRHAMRYYLVPPRNDGVNDGRRRPVIVAITGCGSDFYRFANLYAEADGSRSFLIVCPCTFSNTNKLEGTLRDLYLGVYTDDEIREAETDRLGWDEAGLLAVLDDLAREFHTDDRVRITGFSGGGLLTYRMLLKHAGRVEAAAPVCGNFFDDTSGLAEPRWTGRDASLPIRLILSRTDSNEGLWLGGFLTPTGLPISLACLGAGISFLTWRRTGRWWHVGAIAAVTVMIAAPIALDWFDPIDPQSASAIETLRKRGFTNIRVTRVPGMGHVPAAERVMGVFTDEDKRSK